MILKAVLLFLLGFILLIKGGDWFVDGSASLAKRFKIPEIIIGATVVSIGTTLPEVMVSSSAAALGSSSTAYGNAIGSIICNTALVSAVTIAVMPSSVDRKPLILPVAFFFSAMVLYSGVAYATGYFSRTIGIVLLCIFVIYMVLSVVQTTKNTATLKTPVQEIEEHTEQNQTKLQAFKKTLCYDIILLVAGAGFIALGANFLVDNCAILAKAIGVPESVIALTLVALGTSLPELITAITSLIKGHGALSLGNVIGANLFNLVLVSGMAITISPFNIPTEKTLLSLNASLLVDIPVAILTMIILTVPTIITKKVSRWQGITLLSIYALYTVFQFVI